MTVHKTKKFAAWLSENQDFYYPIYKQKNPVIIGVLGYLGFERVHALTQEALTLQQRATSQATAAVAARKSNETASMFQARGACLLPVYVEDAHRRLCRLKRGYNV